MAPTNAWSTEEKLRLLASIDYCSQHNLALHHSLPKMLAHQGVERNWRAINSMIYRLGEKGAGTSLSVWRKQGSGVAALSDADRARVATLIHDAATSAAVLSLNLTVSSSHTALDSDSHNNASEGSIPHDKSSESSMPRGSKKRAEARSIDQNVSHKRQKDTASDDSYEDSSEPTGKTVGQQKIKKRKMGVRHVKNITKSYNEDTDQHDSDQATLDRESSGEAVQEVVSSTSRLSGPDDSTRENHRTDSPITISDNEESRSSTVHLQTPEVMETDDSRASSRVNTGTLEGHGISALEKAERESEQQDMLQRAESAEARCRELEEQLEVAKSKLDLQTRNEVLEVKLRDLDVPYQTVLREYVKRLERDKDMAEAQASQAELKERQRTESKFGNVQKIEKETERKVKHLEQEHKFEEERSKRKIKFLEEQGEQAEQSEEQSRQKIKQLEQQIKCIKEESQLMIEHLEQRLEYQEEESQRKIEDVEGQAKKMEQHHKESMEREISHSMRLKRDLLDVRKGIVIYRTNNGGFPVEYDYNSVCGRWKDNLVTCLDRLSRSLEPAENLPETTVREDSSLPGLEASLQMVAGIPEMPSGDLDIDSIFENSVEAPSCYNIAMACFIARVLRWCFDTSWHIDEPECTRMDEVWGAVAQIDGLKAVRALDMLATIRKTTNKLFRDVEVPQMAKKQMAIFKEEFRRHLVPFENTFWDDWLTQLMITKLELLISEKHHKIAFVPPGTVYDPAYMFAVDEHTGKFGIKNGVEYRVRICLMPAIIMDIPEQKWPEYDSIDCDPDKYRDALMASRNFFPETSGQWQWDGCPRASQAWVIVDEVRPDIMAID